MNSRVLPLFALLFAAGIFFGYVKMVWSGPIRETKAAIYDNELALAAADEYKKKQNTLASARNAIDPEKLKRLSVFLPDSVDNVGLILDINALAARSGLSLANIDVLASGANDTGSSAGTGALTVARTNPIGSIDLSISAIGNYTALQAFLVGIEKSARLLDVRDITVRSSDTGIYNYKMVVRLYWLR